MVDINTSAAVVAGADRKQPCVDLRGLLRDLADRLIHECNFPPANLCGCSTYMNKTTEPLLRFLIWLEQTPEVRVLLQNMGLWQEGPSQLSALLDQDRLPSLARSRRARDTNNSTG